MTRRRCPGPHLGDLLSAQQAAEVAGYTIESWRSGLTRGRVPAPIGHVGTHPVWTREQLETWLRERDAR